MTRITSQRGVSLLLLIIMITVFAGVAIGVVTLLRSRHESYPYQVQSYQAYTLAHAGAEFAIRLAGENASGVGDYATYFSSGRQFTLGNGMFTLRYEPGTGCGNDKVYSLGTCGTASREIELSYFGSYVAQASVPLVKITGPITIQHYDDCSGGVCYSGSRIKLSNVCDPTLARLPNTYGQPHGLIDGQYTFYPTSIAATRDGAGKQVTLAGVFADGSGIMRAGWLWDSACGDPGSSPWVLCDAAKAASGSLSTCTAGSVGKYVAAGRTLPAWDGTISNAPAQSMQITPVNHSQYSYAHFPTSGNIGVSNDRPRTGVPCDNNLATCCDPNPNTCALPPADPDYFAPCCVGPSRPCCYAPGGFEGFWAPGGNRSYAAGTCIDPQRAPSGALYSGNPWVSRTDYTCSERDFAGNQGHVYVVLLTGGGYINIETLGDITPPVTFYFHFPYETAEYYECRYGQDIYGNPRSCRSQYPPQYVTWVFTVN
jgi:hypothetical protein